MHIVRGNYGQDAGGLTYPSELGASRGARPSMGLAGRVIRDTADVDNILEQVKRDVRSIQAQSASRSKESASTKGAASSCEPSSTSGAGSGEGRAKPDAPVKLPPNTVRGRYVFSGGSQAPGAIGGFGPGTDMAVAQFTPRGALRPRLGGSFGPARVLPAERESVPVASPYAEAAHGIFEGDF